MDDIKNLSRDALITLERTKWDQYKANRDQKFRDAILNNPVDGINIIRAALGKALWAPKQTYNTNPQSEQAEKKTWVPRPEPTLGAVNYGLPGDISQSPIFSAIEIESKLVAVAADIVHRRFPELPVNSNNFAIKVGEVSNRIVQIHIGNILGTTKRKK